MESFKFHNNQTSSDNQLESFHSFPLYQNLYIESKRYGNYVNY